LPGWVKQGRRDALFGNTPSVLPWKLQDNLKGCMSWAYGRQRKIVLPPCVSPAAGAARADAHATSSCTDGGDSKIQVFG
jgi:hypothetical protein